MPDAHDILGLTSLQFIQLAAACGVRAPTAMELYREAFRSGAFACEFARLDVPPIVNRLDEHATTKFIQRHADGLETESVILPIVGAAGRTRNTLCVSSQVGCAMGCTFCETAQMGFMKNLSAAQIVGQWQAARFTLDTPIDNIVFMGMGEPMENLDAVIHSIRILTDRNGAALAAARIAVSTVGRVQGIRRLALLCREPGYHKLRLAVSVNAPNDAIRSQIMPINRSTPMGELMQAMLVWPTDSQRVLIEYVLIPGVNDAMEHADELCTYLRPLRCTVNVIPYNPRRNSPWPAPSEDVVNAFAERVRNSGQLVKRRQTMGRSVMAACGQLGNPTIRGRRINAVVV